MRCSVVNDEKQLVVAHAADIKFYEADDIGPCLGLEGNKRILMYYKNYFIVVSEDNKDVVENNSTVTIYDWRDKRNKFIAYQASFKTVTEVVAEWGRLIVFCSDSDRKVFRLTEQDLHSKMRVLYNKFLYQIAISLARSHGDEGYVMETYQAYGDHLYKFFFIFILFLILEKEILMALSPSIWKLLDLSSHLMLSETFWMLREYTI